MEALTLNERARLKECEDAIEKGLDTFVAVGQALAEIRDSRLYRQLYPTFEDYCREKFQRGRDWAEVTINAAQVVLSLPISVGKPSPSLQQARLLAKVNPELQAKAWRTASADGAPTTKKVRTEVRKARKLKPGSETVRTTDRERALAYFGKLLRALDKIGLTDRTEASMKELLAVIKNS
jgi:hypothetical protein